MKRSLIAALVCLLCLMGLAQPVFAQTATTGQIIGTVKDPTGAVVPSAKIALTSAAGQQRETSSDAQGNYRFVMLPPGTYKLSAQASGFKGLTLDYVNVALTQTTELEVTLQVAAAAEAVNVTAAPPLVDTANPTTGRVIAENQITQLPLPTRNFQQILTLSPGTVSNLSNNTELGRGDVNISVNGQRMTSNSVWIDGTQVISPGTNSTPNISVPAPDAIQEFIVQTSMYDASQGRNAGGNVAVVTKSGTNSFHGDAYEFFRNRVLNANDYFLNKSGIQKPILNRNQFGGTLGGPIVKDKTFFFVSYQGTRERNGTSPTNSLSSANLPAALTNDRSNAAIDGLASAFLTRAPYNIPAAFCNAVTGCGLFVNSITRALLQKRLPNGQWAIPSAAAGTATGATLVNTPLSGLSKFREDQFSVNIDQAIGPKNKLAGRFFFSDTPQEQAIYNFNGANTWQVPGYGGTLDYHNRVLTLSDTHMFTANLINQARFGFSRINGPSKPEEPFKGSDFAGGITNPLCATNSSFCGMPTIGVTNSFTIGSYGLADQRSVVETFEWSDMVSYTHGKHFLRFGAEVQRYHADFNFNFWSRGQIFFNDWATFMMGIPLMGMSGNGVRDRGMRTTDVAWYVQDDLKLTQNLTLNLGLRMGHNGGIKEIRNRLEGFDPAAYARNNFPCSLLTPCVNGFFRVNDSLTPADFTVAPRFGFAWKPLTAHNNFVVRGGFGVYFDRYSFRVANLQVLNYPYAVLGYVFGAPLGPGTFSNPFPNLAGLTFPLNGNIPSPVTYTMMIGGVNYTFPIPISGIYPNANLRTPYVYQYNFGAQYEPVKNLLVEVGYVGSKGTKLLNVVNLNQGATGQLPYGSVNFTNNKLGTAFQRADTSGISHYDSLQASVTKRFGHGLQFLASYTFSKSIDDNSGTPVNELYALPGDESSRASQRAVSDFYRPQRFVFSGVYDLPTFYKGDSGLVKHVVNSWEMSGVLTAQSGSPFSVICSSGNTTFNRANLVAGATPGLSGSVDSRLDGYFNRTAFASSCVNAPPYGTSPRNFLRGPSQRNVDLSIVKFFPINESKKVEFRTEFFNVFNLVNFANPINTFTSGDTLGSYAQLGKVYATSAGPRIIQFALKFSF